MGLQAELERKRRAINHLRRIGGQLRKLEEEVGRGADPREVGVLCASVAKSLSSWRRRYLEEYVVHGLVKGRVKAQRLEELRKILKLSE